MHHVLPSGAHDLWRGRKWKEISFRPAVTIVAAIYSPQHPPLLQPHQVNVRIYSHQKRSPAGVLEYGCDGAFDGWGLVRGKINPKINHVISPESS